MYVVRWVWDLLTLPLRRVPEHGTTATTILWFFVYIQDLQSSVVFAVRCRIYSFPCLRRSKSWIYIYLRKPMRVPTCVIAGLLTEDGVIQKHGGYMYVYIYIGMYIYIYMSSYLTSCTYICHSMYAPRTWSYTEKLTCKHRVQDSVWSYTKNQRRASPRITFRFCIV